MKSFNVLVIGVVFSFVAIGGASAGVKYTDGDKYIKLGGRIQLQYHQVDPDDGDSADTLLFRRFRPYIEGSVHKDWMGKFQWDMGKSTFAVKDAYMAYTGLDRVDIVVGNHNFPFSRELLTSSKKQQLVERTFVGDHNYGTPDRQAGIHLLGNALEKKMAWGASVCIGAVDPSTKKIDFDTVVQTSYGDDWSQGVMTGARVDFFPLGQMKFSQGDFKKEVKIGLGFAAFSWQNDDDNLAVDRGDDDTERVDDVDYVTGIEVSAALRGYGISIDVEYNSFDSELTIPGVTSGLYEDSKTTLENYAVEAGYMISALNLEIVAGYENQDADNYAEAWTRVSGGVNYYFKKHDIKMQTTYRMGESKDGKEDADSDEIFIQCQYVF